MFFVLQMKVEKFFLIICSAVVFSLFTCGCISKKVETPVTLAGSCWAPVSGPSGAVLEFTSDGKRIVGTTNGNRFFAPVKRMENNILHFGDLAVTRAMVRDPEKERVFLEGLSSARGWSFEGNILVLEDERKRPVLRLYPLQRVKNIPVKK
jgi:hypothetical protein